LAEVGPMDAGFRFYFEDSDWCQRFRRAGWKIRYTPEAEIVHLGAHATSQNPVWARIEWYLSLYRYLSKHYGGLTATFFRFLILARGAMRVTLRRLARGGRDGSGVERELLARTWSYRFR